METSFTAVEFYAISPWLCNGGYGVGGWITNLLVGKHLLPHCRSMCDTWVSSISYSADGKHVCMDVDVGWQARMPHHSALAGPELFQCKQVVCVARDYRSSLSLALSRLFIFFG